MLDTLATGLSNLLIWARKYILSAPISWCVKWERPMSYLSGSKEMSVQGLDVLESSPQMKTIMTSGKSECQSHSEFGHNSCSSSSNQRCPRTGGVTGGQAYLDEFALNC